ncbi:MAG: hypothetical protein ACO1QR_16620, partial [Chthoniobacteraceae bacterium]
AEAVTYVGTVHNGDGTATVTYRSTQPYSPTRAKVFMRLRVAPCSPAQRIETSVPRSSRRALVPERAILAAANRSRPQHREHVHENLALSLPLDLAGGGDDRGF